MKYDFTSERLGFRNWEESDIPKMVAISSNPQVMEFFPATATPEQTKTFIQKMQKLYQQKGYCYFAVDELKTKEFIGFIGLSEPAYEAPFTPCVDLGWRLSPTFWNKGYATEGAKQCIHFAFNILKLKSLKATAPQVNIKSIAVMKKVGMHKLMDFKHPLLNHVPHLENCVCYNIDNI